MAWYWWATLVIGWLFVGTGMLALFGYVSGRYSQRVTPTDSMADLACAVLLIVLWPVTILIIGVAAFDWANEVGAKHGKRPQQ